jgi:hypothetical protein
MPRPGGRTTCRGARRTGVAGTRRVPSSRGALRGTRHEPQ